MEFKQGEVFKFISEQKIPEGFKIISSNAVWSFSSNLTTFSFNSGKVSGEYSIGEFHLNPTFDKIVNAGFIENYKKIFIFCFRNRSPTLLLIYLDESEPAPKPSKYYTVLLSSLSFHNVVYNVFSPFTNSFCVISREGVSIHSIENLSVIYEKIWVTHSIQSCCFHENILATLDEKSFSIFQFLSNDKCERIAKIKNKQLNSLPKQIFKCNQHILLISTNSASTKFFIKLIQFHPLIIFERSIELIESFNNVKFDQIFFSLFDQALLISSTQTTLLIDLHGAKPVSFGPITGKPSSQIVNDHYLVSLSNNAIYEFQEDYQSIPDPCPYEVIGAIIRRKNGLQTALDKLTANLKQNGKVTSSTIITIIDTIGQYAILPTAQIRFTRVISYSTITNQHLILLALILYSNVLKSRLVPEARKPLLDILAKEEIIQAVPSLLRQWNQKLDKNSMDILLSANEKFFYIDYSFFQNPTDFIRACIESGRKERANTFILMESTGGKKSKDLASVIELYIQKFGDNLQRSYRKLLNYMES